MKLYLFLFSLIFSGHLLAESDEISLIVNCKKADLIACENLSAYYIKTEKWENAFAIGEALCKKEVMKGCTFAGTALLAQGKAKEGLSFLTKSCDGFEPFSCRSLSRLYKKNRQDHLSYIFGRRACHYGLDEVCKDLKAPKKTYSKKGREFLSKTIEDCDDPGSTLCQDKLKSLDNCTKTLTEIDCQLIPGELSIFFRSKLIQNSAKATLKLFVAFQNEHKNKHQRFSYDLKSLFKDRENVRSSYVFGFLKTCTKRFESRKALSTSLAMNEEFYKDLSSRTKKNISSFFYKGKAADCYDPKFGYEAFALANLDPQNPAKLDIWKVNQDGNLIHQQNGLPVP